MSRARRWLRRIGIALAVFVVALTAASLIFNAVTAGRDVAAAKLYPGPWAPVDGTELAYRSWGSHGTPIVLLGGFIEPSWVCDASSWSGSLKRSPSTAAKRRCGWAARSMPAPQPWSRTG